MPDDTTAAIKALIQQVATLTETVQKQDEIIRGVKDRNDRLLDQKKDDKRSTLENDRFAALLAAHEKQMRETAILLGTKPEDPPKNIAAVVLTREQARDRQTYQEAEARAKARGVPLRVASDGDVQSWRNNKAPVVQTKTFSFDDTHDGIRYVRADMHDGPGNVQRQLTAEREGLKLRTFRTLDDLPAHARQKFELMEAAANANGES
ncbi:hypothetical protein [Cypionkella sp.]|uniref:hypothetical protein n=1 Tax=Cypionkella sp. TaxID=2811411 RepID=UPI002ABC2023|nr:hypothetical protein [Cypionkella sp.]MDZ4393908.1 hypothetical protein [Cypionkella sp.]